MTVLIFDEFHDVLRIVVLLPGIKLRDSVYFRDYFLYKYFEQIFCSFLALVHELAHVVQAFLYHEVSKLVTHHFFQFFIFFNFGDDLFKLIKTGVQNTFFDDITCKFVACVIAYGPFDLFKYLHLLSVVKF